VFIPAVWKLIVPPRAHFFLWLLSMNKSLTRDNVEKRKKIDSNSCLFCNEKDTVNHLFFEYAAAQKIWEEVSEILGEKVYFTPYYGGGLLYPKL
jgi:hypothetical protein